MAKEFNVPPVIFPSGGNPAAAASGPQQRRLPTAPFQPPRSSNPGLPFLSFDINSAAASTSFSAAPQFSSNIGGAIGGVGFDDEAPLLEELGINTKQIYQKTLSILNPFRINHHLHEDADLSGPFIFLMAFGLFQLLAGKLHFGIILGWVTMASMFLYVIFNMLAGKNGNLDMYKCLSLIGYCMLPIVMLSALSLFVPQGGMVIMVITGLFVIWSTRVCTGLVVELANCGDEHRGLIAGTFYMRWPNLLMWCGSEGSPCVHSSYVKNGADYKCQEYLILPISETLFIWELGSCLLILMNGDFTLVISTGHIFIVQEL